MLIFMLFIVISPIFNFPMVLYFFYSQEKVFKITKIRKLIWQQFLGRLEYRKVRKHGTVWDRDSW